MRIYIEITGPSGSVRKYPIEEKPIKVGRLKGSNIQTDDPLCSGSHAILYTQGDCLFVEDLDSKNGTYLNGITIRKQRVYLDDIVQMGDTKIQIDRFKNPPEVLDLLAADSTRLNGEITLELETFNRRDLSQKNQKARSVEREKQQKFVRESKLYAGVAAQDRPPPEPANKLSLQIKEYLALSLDLVLALIMAAGGFAVAGSSENEDKLFNFLAAGVCGIVFHYWNRKRETGSFGEKALKLDQPSK